MSKPEALGEGNPCRSQRTGKEHSDNTVLLARTCFGPIKPGEFW